MAPLPGHCASTRRGRSYGGSNRRRNRVRIARSISFWLSLRNFPTFRRPRRSVQIVSDSTRHFRAGQVRGLRILLSKFSMKTDGLRLFPRRRPSLPARSRVEEVEYTSATHRRRRSSTMIPMCLALAAFCALLYAHRLGRPRARRDSLNPSAGQSVPVSSWRPEVGCRP